MINVPLHLHIIPEVAVQKIGLINVSIEILLLDKSVLKQLYIIPLGQ
jgi:hypothetical protein